MQDSKPRVAVIDADGIPFTVCYNKKGKPEKSLEDCIALCDDFINNINKAVGAEFYIGYTTRGRCFRYNVNPAYKANRKDAVFPKYSSQVRDYLVSTHGFKWIDNYEADDSVLSFKTQYSDRYECIIVSPDKDILNLEGKHFNPKKMQFVETDSQQANKYFWKSMIKGDSGDNIKGIYGLGEVASEEIINDTTKYYHERVLTEYIDHFGQYEGIEEFYKNYKCLQLVNNVPLGDIQLNNVNKVMSE